MVWQLFKSCSRDFVLAWIPLVRILDASCVHLRRVLHAFQARLAHVPDSCKRYLGAELHHNGDIVKPAE